MILYISHAYLKSRLPSGIFDSLGKPAILRKVIRNSDPVTALQLSGNLIANSSDLLISSKVTVCASEQIANWIEIIRSSISISDCGRLLSNWPTKLTKQVRTCKVCPCYNFCRLLNWRVLMNWVLARLNFPSKSSTISEMFPTNRHLLNFYKWGHVGLLACDTLCESTLTNFGQNIMNTGQITLLMFRLNPF